MPRSKSARGYPGKAVVGGGIRSIWRCPRRNCFAPSRSGAFESGERDRSVQPRRDQFCQFSRPSGGPSYSASETPNWS